MSFSNGNNIGSKSCLKTLDRQSKAAALHLPNDNKTNLTSDKHSTWTVTHEYSNLTENQQNRHLRLRLHHLKHWLHSVIHRLYTDYIFKLSPHFHVAGCVS